MTHLLYDTKNDIPLTREELDLVPTPAPLGRFHQPYAFNEYMFDVSRALAAEGLTVANEEYAITKDSQKMFGLLEIKPIEGQLIQADDWKLMLGVRGSHDQSIQRGLVLGSQVMVCSNLCFSGNVSNFKTKQTLNIQLRLPGLIRAAVAKIPELARSQESIYNTYKDRELTLQLGDSILVELFNRGGLSSVQLGRACKEWRKSSYEEHDQNGFTIWRLLNACTEAIKPTGNNVNMHIIAERTQIITGYLDDVCDW